MTTYIKVKNYTFLIPGILKTISDILTGGLNSNSNGWNIAGWPTNPITSGWESGLRYKSTCKHTKMKTIKSGKINQ